MEALIDFLFGAGHCKADYERIMADRPMVADWATVRGALRALVLLLSVPVGLLFWLLY
jgi:hypothetical protein